MITAATNPKATKSLMPWTLRRTESGASSDEVATATAELEAGVIFT